MKTPNVCRSLGRSGSCTAHSKAPGAGRQVHSRNRSVTGCTRASGIKGWAEHRKIQKLTMPGQQFSHGKGILIDVMPDIAPLHPEIHTNTYTDIKICLPSPHFQNTPSQAFPLTSPCLEGPHTISLSSFRGTEGSDRACDCCQSLLSHGSQKLPALQE